MWKFSSVVTVGAVAVFLLAHAARGQMSGTTQMSSAKVTQGQNMHISVSLDKAPNFPGNVLVTVLPDGQLTGGFGFNCGLDQGQTSCQPSAHVPLDAKLGKWRVSEIAFRPESGEPKSLGMHGELSFEVVPHGEIVLPDSATISDIK